MNLNHFSGHAKSTGLSIIIARFWIRALGAHDKTKTPKQRYKKCAEGLANVAKRLIRIHLRSVWTPLKYSFFLLRES